MAGQGQRQQDTAMRGMNERQRQMLEDLRRRRAGGGMSETAMSPSLSMLPFGDGPVY
jgi:hypothetical protein